LANWTLHQSPKCGFIHFADFQVPPGVHLGPLTCSTPSGPLKCALAMMPRGAWVYLGRQPSGS
jgi:hypothetical protein